jgi:hypothetical protein
VGFDTCKDNNGATLGESGFNQRDSEVGARTVRVERRSLSGMRGDWLGGWRGLTGVRSIGSGRRNEMLIRRRGWVGLVGRIVPSGWGGNVIKTWRGGW